MRLFCDKSLYETTTKPLAQIVAEIPQAGKLFLASTEERSKEAPYVMLQEKFCAEELKCIRAERTGEAKLEKAPKKLNLYRSSSR